MHANNMLKNCSNLMALVLLGSVENINCQDVACDPFRYFLPTYYLQGHQVMHTEKFVGREDTMQGRNRMLALPFILIVALMIMPNQLVCAAEDDLYLTGIVKDVDHLRKTVSIDVASSSCQGMKKFVVDDVDVFEGLVNARINFFIDSSVCKGDEVYKVLSVGRKMK
jgi:hypothetical protein